MGWHVNRNDPNYNPNRPEDSEEYVNTAGLSCTECNHAKGKLGEKCQNFRSSRNAQCSGSVFRECGTSNYSSASAAVRRHAFPIGNCTFEEGHNGTCSWKLSGQKCTVCAGRGLEVFKGRTLAQETALGRMKSTYDVVTGIYDRDEIEPRREACRQCGGSGKMP